MAYSSAYKKQLAASAQTLNTNGGSKSSTSSSGGGTSKGSSGATSGGTSGNYLGATMELASTNKSNIKGVNDALYASMNEEFAPSSKVTDADNKTDKTYSNLESIVNTKDIVSQDVWDSINSKFVVPSAVTEADAWLSNQLSKIQSGKTSYSDQVRDMMDKIMNREKFSYDVDTDPLFQQALASAMNSGKQAMQDTIGQASALTGGYGSTYATSAGNQAYNSFIEDAYDNLPQYYEMSMKAYQMEGDEMYRQYSMLSTEDEKEYNRNISAYDATYQHRNQIYNEAYSQFRDSKTDAFATANLQLNEHGQRVNDAYNLYNASSNQADKLYEREYTKWADEVNLAYKQAEMLNSDWQNQANRDFQSSESEKNRVWQTTESEKDRAWKTTEAEKERAFTASENAKNRAASRSGGSGGSGGSGEKLKSATENQMKKALDAYNNGGMAELNKYLNSVPDNYDKDSIANYVGQYGELPYSQRTYTVIDDGGWNVGWGVDNNAKVKDQYGNEFTLKQLKEYDKDIALELSNKKYTKGTSYTKK